MSSDEDETIPHPRSSYDLFGHQDAEQTLLDSYKSGRMPHAWLIGGPPGIGKATLAYRLARFVLAHPDPSGPDVQDAKTLAVSPDNPVSHRVAAQSHGDLLTLERIIDEKKDKLFTEIRAEEARASVSFFGSTASEGGWRIAIIDPVDDLNRTSANAMLKVLEEPPPRALLLLVSHALSRVLPTIRSRCRRLMLRPLAAADIAHAVASITGNGPSDKDVKAAAEASDGSVSRALAILDGSTLAVRQKVLDLLAQLPNPDPRALHALGDALPVNEPEALEAFTDIVNDWLSARLAQGEVDKAKAARLADAWDKINQSARDADAYNLDRRPLVFNVFNLLSETARAA
jgi:DNA polymerase-3 subunit delta'